MMICYLFCAILAIAEVSAQAPPGCPYWPPHAIGTLDHNVVSSTYPYPGPGSEIVQGGDMEKGKPGLHIDTPDGVGYHGAYFTLSDEITTGLWSQGNARALGLASRKGSSGKQFGFVQMNSAYAKGEELEFITLTQSVNPKHPRLSFWVGAMLQEGDSLEVNMVSRSGKTRLARWTKEDFPALATSCDRLWSLVNVSLAPMFSVKSVLRDNCPVIPDDTFITLTMTYGAMPNTFSAVWFDDFFYGGPPMECYSPDVDDNGNGDSVFHKFSLSYIEFDLVPGICTGIMGAVLFSVLYHGSRARKNEKAAGRLEGTLILACLLAVGLSVYGYYDYNSFNVELAETREALSKKYELGPNAQDYDKGVPFREKLFHPAMALTALPPGSEHLWWNKIVEFDDRDLGIENALTPQSFPFIGPYSLSVGSFPGAPRIEKLLLYSLALDAFCAIVGIFALIFGFFAPSTAKRWERGIFCFDFIMFAVSSALLGFTLYYAFTQPLQFEGVGFVIDWQGGDGASNPMIVKTIDMDAINPATYNVEHPTSWGNVEYCDTNSTAYSRMDVALDTVELCQNLRKCGFTGDTPQACDFSSVRKDGVCFSTACNENIVIAKAKPYSELIGTIQKNMWGGILLDAILTLIDFIVIAGSFFVYFFLKTKKRLSMRVSEDGVKMISIRKSFECQNIMFAHRPHENQVTPSPPSHDYC